MIFKILVTIYIVFSSILIHLEWKQIENLEQWVMHLMKQTEHKESE